MFGDAALFVFAPVLAVIEPHYQALHAFLAAPKTHRFVLKSLVFAALFALLFVGAVLAYAGAYALYVPQVGFSRVVPLVPRPAPAAGPAGVVMLGDLLVGQGPTTSTVGEKATAVAAAAALSPAQLQLEREFLARAQPYDLSLELQVAGSPHNQAIGTFAVHTTLANANGTALYHTARPAALQYRSNLARIMTELLYALPVALAGYSPEHQTLRVSLVEAVLTPAPLPPPSAEDLTAARAAATAASARRKKRLQEQALREQLEKERRQQQQQAQTSKAEPSGNSADAPRDASASSGSWWPLGGGGGTGSGSKASAADQPPPYPENDSSDDEMDEDSIAGDHPGHDGDEDIATGRAPPTARRAYAAMHAEWRWTHAVAVAAQKSSAVLAQVSGVASAPATLSPVPQPPARYVFAPSGRGAGRRGRGEARDVAMAIVQLGADVRVQRAILRVDAQFHGLRYLMYHWFLTSASVGVGVFMVWEVLLGLALWRMVVGKRITVEVLEEEDEDDDEVGEDVEEEGEEEDVNGTVDDEDLNGSGDDDDDDSGHGETVSSNSASTGSEQRPLLPPQQSEAQQRQSEPSSSMQSVPTAPAGRPAAEERASEVGATLRQRKTPDATGVDNTSRHPQNSPQDHRRGPPAAASSSSQNVPAQE